MVQCAIGLFAPLPPAFVHALDFFVTATGALVLLRARDGDERIYLRQRMRILHVTKYRLWWKGSRGMYLTGAGPSRRCRTRRGHRSSRRAVRSARHSVGMPGVLLRPWVIALLRVSLIVRHVVVRRVRRVLRVSRAGCGYRRIYRYLRVRLVLLGMMVILLSIL